MKGLLCGCLSYYFAVAIILRAMCMDELHAELRLGCVSLSRSMSQSFMQGSELLTISSILPIAMQIVFSWEYIHVDEKLL